MLIIKCKLIQYSGRIHGSIVIDAAIRQSLAYIDTRCGTSVCPLHMYYYRKRLKNVWRKWAGKKSKGKIHIFTHNMMA